MRKRKLKRVKKTLQNFFNSNLDEISREVKIPESAQVDLAEESDLIKIKALLKPEINAIVEDIIDISYQGKPKKREKFALDQIRRLIKIQTSMKQLNEQTIDKQIHLFEIETLREVHHKVDFCKDNMEDAVILTGPVFSDLYLPRRIIEFKKERSGGHIQSDTLSLSETIIQLQKKGYNSLALAHSHPGTSPPSPSPKDRKQQSKFERKNMDILGLIFTSNGYVRFYTNDFDYELLFYGKGIRRLEDGLFKLDIESGEERNKTVQIGENSKKQ